jgi:hypothetical protein
MSACPRSYGVSVSAFYSNIEHHSQDQVVDSLTKTAMAKEQLMWLIKKGDLILSDQPTVVRRWFTMNFLEKGPKRGIIPIYVYDDDDIPERLGNSKNGKLNSSSSYLLPCPNTCLRINYLPYARV